MLKATSDHIGKTLLFDGANKITFKVTSVSECGNYFWRLGEIYPAIMVKELPEEAAEAGTESGADSSGDSGG